MKVFHYVMLKKESRFAILQVTDHVVIRLLSQGVCYYIIPIYTWIRPLWLQIHVHCFNFFEKESEIQLGCT